MAKTKEYQMMVLLVEKMGEAVERDGTLEEVDRLQRFAELYAQITMADSLLRIAEALEHRDITISNHDI